jgi:transposase
MFYKQHDGYVIRKAVLMYMKGDTTFRKVAEALDVGKSSVHRWYNALHKVVSRSPKRKRHCRRKPKFPSLLQDVKNLFNSPSLTYCSLLGVKSDLPYTVSTSWIRATLKKARISRRRFHNLKKIGKGVATAARVDAFKEKVRTISMDEIVCLDETGFVNRGNAIFGYFPMGRTPAPSAARKREHISCLMAISSSHVVHYVLQDVAYNADTFLNFLEALVPKLHPRVKYILMDNLSFHHNKRVKDFLVSRKLQPLYIPPYSPQFNPIEEVFSQLKRRFQRLYLIDNKPFNQSVRDAVNDISNFYNTIVHYEHCIRFP